MLTSITGVQTQALASAPAGAAPTIPNLNGTAAITGNHYAGSLSGGSLAGTSSGGFYGPTANETAGVWKVAGGGVTALGSYGATK